MAGSAWSEIKRLHAQTTLGAKEGLAFRYFSRPLASALLYLIRDTRITPNQVTISSLVVALAGMAFHVLDLEHRGLLVGAALFMIAHVLDALDGQLARLRKAGSELGMHFDFYIDELKAYFLWASITVRLYLQCSKGDVPALLEPVTDAGLGAPAILVLGIVGLSGLAIGISSTRFFKLPGWRETTAAAGRGETRGPLRVIEQIGHFVVDYPSYFVFVCLADAAEIYFLVYGAVVLAYAIRSILQIAVRLWRIDPYRRDDGA